ncbi:MAG: ATP-dependent DNA helicase RecG [Candidatus Omnitrophota bacterium]
MEKSVATSIRYVKGIGPKKADSFHKFAINTIEDLFYYFPKRYEDRTRFSPISQLQEGQVQTVKAKVLARGGHESFRRRGFSIVEIAVGDEGGKIHCVWFNQPYLKEYFKVGVSLVLYGKVEHYGDRLQINSPEFEIISDDQDESLNIGRIVPIYTLPQGFTQRGMRKVIHCLLEQYLGGMNDFLPYDIRSRQNLLNSAKSLINIHFPEDLNIQKLAYERLAFEEFFIFQLPLVLRKLKRKVKKGIIHKIDSWQLDSFITGLTFKLTKAQERVIEEIKEDLNKPEAMQRLLQGDVGSGKTIVATIAGMIAIQGGYQVAFMVPTEILAKQHYTNIGSRFHVLGFRDREIKLGLLTSALKKTERIKLYKEIEEGKIDLVIGTHALLEQDVKFKKLGLVVIDEQHKFGVGQRALLPKKGANPDVLIMTATPIPRTLAITLYGDLDISVINELPAGRLPIKTLRFNQEDKEKAYEIVREELKKGRQAYIIYPVIEESYILDIAGAKKMYAELKIKDFKQFRLGLIHGRLKQSEQDRVMESFKNKELDILIATTVLEVGIDVPDATCMIIEHAQRFGLSQLHQLRGRVGRSSLESVCVLISDAKSPEAEARIDVMVKHNDGFRISEEDLQIRGPGEFFGRRQHGLVELKIGNPITQMELLRKAREEAVKLVSLDPHLELRQDQILKKKLLERFPEYEKLMLVG